MPIISNFPGGTGSGGGLTLGAVSDINVLVASGKTYVKWTDPSDIVVSGAALAAWGGTQLVRKAGSAPKSRRDGHGRAGQQNTRRLQDLVFLRQRSFQRRDLLL